MRETLQQAAKRLLDKAPGSEHIIAINVNDGLTGFPNGFAPRDARVKTTTVVIDEQTRADGKKRLVVVAKPKGTVLATAAWT
jgi:hypothetical protein